MVLISVLFLIYIFMTIIYFKKKIVQHKCIDREIVLNQLFPRVKREILLKLATEIRKELIRKSPKPYMTALKFLETMRRQVEDEWIDRNYANRDELERLVEWAKTMEIEKARK